ncbi:FAD binding domain-containing protein [Oscillochloris sp. ZM17-4]|uniref:FAD binding domain-containing protein n=1 Tax=Oscillochloris sp. ZM17-4 TaxID=2866714 RepID=UPI001C73AF46|nr:FAD binding domain-containing protein [Oscillochloris sp. ZM17-4]MBX0326365.1 FAD binding domain-containing protein [Oscillochloris sp. ZM17-4]
MLNSDHSTFNIQHSTFNITPMWKQYYQPETLVAAIALLAAHPGARVVAGGSDVMVELSRGIRPAETLVDISRVAGLRYAEACGDSLHIGALATHNMVISSKACVAGALPLAQACAEIGAPQIRARATVAGNLLTASPANDTITPLVALGAELSLVGPDGERSLPLGTFHLGVRRTALRPGELLREIRLPALAGRRRGIFLKLGLRRAQAISVINVAVVIEQAGDAPDSPVLAARVALGCVSPTIIQAPAAEAFLVGRGLDAATCLEAGRLASHAAAPIDDLRGTAAYRRHAVVSMVAEALKRLAAGEERRGWPARPVLLESPDRGQGTGDRGQGDEPDQPLRNVLATVNGAPVALSPQKTLLDALREDAGLTGTKEGCAEGECGACTVWLDGQAVMACLVPAAQAHGASVTTIEGLAAAHAQSSAPPPPNPHPPTPTPQPPGNLHPLQAAFIASGAVQCGYCIPGMLMAGAKLLDEQGSPDVPAIQSALSGNICRCTGYRKIIAAVRAVAGQPQGEEPLP